MKSIICICSLIILPVTLFAQNSEVRWSCFDMGFSRTGAVGWETWSAVGQGFVMRSSYGNTRVESGLLANLGLRGTVTDVQESKPIPAEFSLTQNYPNPFNPSTRIEFRIRESDVVILKVFDILGREVTTLVNEVKDPGDYAVAFDAANLASGPYFYRLTAGSYVAVRKMMVLR